MRIYSNNSPFSILHSPFISVHDWLSVSIDLVGGQGGAHDSLDGVHAVFGFIKDLGSRASEYLISHLLLGQAKAFVHCLLYTSRCV